MSTLIKRLHPLVQGTAAGIFLSACVGTDLAVPTAHPGNPQARSGRLTELVALRPDLDPSDGASASNPHAHGTEQGEAPSQATDPHAGHGSAANTGHDQHEVPPPDSVKPSAADPTAGAAKAASGGSGPAVYTCPMHPNVERSEPGRCPICGMKLLPKKALK